MLSQEVIGKMSCRVYIQIFLILVVSLFFSFFTHNVALAATFLPPGALSGNTSWTLANSPYVIDSDVNIPPGLTLIIEPGVVVKFKNSFSTLDVEGMLNASGTADAPIIFTSYKDDIAGGDTNGDGSSSFPSSSNNWRAIIFHHGSISTVQHASIRYGGQFLFISGSFQSFPMLRNEGGILSFNNVELSSRSASIDTFNQTGGNTTIANAKIGNTRNGIVISGG